MKIGIIGMGMVGEAVAFGLRRIGHTVFGFDTDERKHQRQYQEIITQTELVFICVPTPCSDDGSCNTTTVASVLTSLRADGYAGLVVIKSTVPPGTTEKFRQQFGLWLAFCPEFLRERARFSDFYEYQELCIAGVTGGKAAELIRQAHGSLPKHFVVMTPTEAELAKYFVNCFNAYRINFANAFCDVCWEMEADYKKIKDAVTWRADTKSSYLDSNENFRAFGGSCLPKDTRAFARFVKSRGLLTDLFEHIVEENKRVESGMRLFGEFVKRARSA